MMTTPLRSCLVYLGVFCFFFAILMPAVAIGSSAPETNNDLIVVLDQSWSMKEREPGNPDKGYEKDPFMAKKSRGAIEAINHVVDDFLKQGDYFSVIVFGNQSELLLTQQILYKHERDFIKNRVKSLRFEDQKTDILSGLKQASDLLLSLDTPHRRKILVMVTDGINDPPETSPYARPDEQNKVFEELSGSIRFNKWNVTLVGLGEHTDITDVAEKLGLPADRALSLEDHQNFDEITSDLVSHIQEEQDSFISMTGGVITVQMHPKLSGGYETKKAFISIQSSFKKKTVSTGLHTIYPILIKGNDDNALNVGITPLKFDLTPGQSAQFELNIGFQGKRPDRGSISRAFSFQFAEASTPFYPNEGSFEILLPSWWEVYGVYAVIAAVLLLSFFILTIFLIRRAQVPRIQISVTANSMPLGENMTLRRKEFFTIANRDFTGRSVPAKGLNCDTAAKVRYLGRRKFEVTGVDAKIIDGGKEIERLKIGMDVFFDLKDKDGNVLGLIAINKPGFGNDPFGGSHGNDPF